MLSVGKDSNLGQIRHLNSYKATENVGGVKEVVVLS